MQSLGYEYVMHLDDDSFFLSKVPYNIFHFMRENQFEYAYRNICRESGETGSKWFDFIQQSLKDSNISSIGWILETCIPSKISEPNSIEQYTYENCGEGFGFYNNFFVAKISVFLRSDIQLFLNAVDESGNMYKYRWNDLIIQSQAVQLFIPQDRIHRFVGFGYAHFSGPLKNIVETKSYGIAQGGLFETKPFQSLLDFSRKHNMGLRENSVFLLNGIPTWAPFFCKNNPFERCLG